MAENTEVVEQSGTGGPSYIRSRGMLFPRNPLLSKRIRANLRTDQYEARESDAVQKLVGPDDVVLELGAGIGYMSTLCAKVCKAKAVHAYEANPNLIHYIHEVHEANGVTTATVHNAMVGQKAGTATFYVRKNFLASSTTLLNPNAEPPPSEQIEVHDAKKVTKELRPSILICDIEGAEKDVVPAMDLSSLRGAVVELHPQWIGETGVRAVFEAMMAAGLTYFPRRSNAKVVCFRRDW